MSSDRSQREAYELAERLEKRVNGERLFLNYNSYKASVCKRRKKGKLRFV